MRPSLIIIYYMNKVRRHHFDSTVAQLDHQIQQIERNRVHNQKDKTPRHEQLYRKGVAQLESRRASQVNTQDDMKHCTFSPRTNLPPRIIATNKTIKTTR